MGRRRQSNFDDPPRFHKKGRVWYHVSGSTPRVWTKLSSDRAEALRLWAQRECVREDDSTKLFSVVARRYIREVFPTKSAQTRKDNDKELANLLKGAGDQRYTATQIEGIHETTRRRLTAEDAEDAEARKRESGLPMGISPPGNAHAPWERCLFICVPRRSRRPRRLIILCAISERRSGRASSCRPSAGRGHLSHRPS